MVGCINNKVEDALALSNANKKKRELMALSQKVVTILGPKLSSRALFGRASMSSSANKNPISISSGITRLGLVGSHLRPLTCSTTTPMATEKDKALAAVPSDSPTIFDKIINKEIPSNVVYEDDKVLAFRDISPQAPTHILIIPKVKDGLTGLSQAEERHKEILGHLMYTAKVIAKQEGLDDGFRIVINDGPSGCQSVYHIHVHLLGGRQMNWPPG